MDVSRYAFLCQKALHQGLQYARSLGHQFLEVEHVALAMLRAGSVELSRKDDIQLQSSLSHHLAQLKKVFGNVTIKFGNRLDKALDEAEALQKEELIDADLLWSCLVKQSTVISNVLLSSHEEESPAVQAELKAKIEEPSDFQDNDVSNSYNNNLAKDKATDTEQAHKLPDKLEKTLADYTIDLTAMAERGEIDPVIGRDMETRRVIEILGRKKKNNPVLIGEPGVGKTAIAEVLAQRIVEGRVSETMRSKRVLSLDLGSMIAGARFRGEFEERMKNLIAAIKACGGNIILFIDEIHMLVGAGSAEGSADAANLMKPALARGELQCLGATTLDEYRNYIEKDPALERRFQIVYVEEPNRETTLSILRGIKSRYEIHHGVQINDDALVSAVDMSIRFLSGRKLPDKAIDLLDEACSKLRMQIDSVPAIMDDLRAQIDQLEIERKAIGNDKTAQADLTRIKVKLDEVQSKYKESEKLWRKHQILLENLRKHESQKQELDALFENAKSQGNFDLAASLQYAEIPKLDQKLGDIRNELEDLQKDHAWLRQEVGNIEIADVISTWTGIPVQRLVKDESIALLSLEDRLRQRIFGQDLALAKVAQAIKRARVGVNDPNRPLGVFLFLGPTGVGKTETAKVLAKEVFNDEGRMVRIDMSEFMEQHNVARLIGSPPGYVGYGEGGELTEPVRRTAYTVVLLDEIEKAHPKVLDILLQIFEDGRLTDGKGRLVDFRNTLIIMTSNLSVRQNVEFTPIASSDDDIRGDLAAYLRPEFVGRIDEIVVFRKLGRRHLESLLNKLCEDLNKRLSKRQFRVLIGSGLFERLLKDAVSSQFGGRALRRTFQSVVVDAVSERILKDPKKCRGVWIVDIDSEGGYFWMEDYSPHTYLMPASGG